MVQGMNELLWSKIILEYFKVESEGPSGPIHKSAISIAQNPVQHDRIKYIEVAINH